MFNPDFANNYDAYDIENIFDKEMFRINITDDELKLMKDTFIKSLNFDFDSHQSYMKFMNKELHNRFPKTKMIHAYRMLLKSGDIQRNYNLERFMKLKGTRGNSGIVSVTVFTSPYQFGDKNNIKNGGCPMNCHYCPFEKDANGVPTQPRSYLSTEPGNKRATQNKHHPVGQIFDRLNTLEKMGHVSSIPDESSKVDFIVSGGTFNFYPEDYIIWFSTMAYFAMNVYYDYKLTGILREPYSLEEEQKINETAPIRMIGFTIETRPDYLTTKDDYFKYIRLFRRIGVTLVQIGTQHTDNQILKYINRGCTTEQNKQGNKLLKKNGFKVVNHWMLDLPSSSPEKDIKMIDDFINDPDYQVDQWKVYPTEVTPFTKILEWYNDGTYKPYAEEDNGEKLENVIIYLKERVPYYTRIIRVIRDIPPESIYGGISCPDMRKNILEKMAKSGKVCKCIRCREVKDGNFDINDCHLFVEKYYSCDGDEYFISYENKNRTKLYGFIRLRLNKSYNDVLPELYDYALIRELHVYGQHTAIGNKENNKTQHRGLGKKLIAKAEEIAALNGFEKIAIIAGVGVREYYKKIGYVEQFTYMVKNIDLPMKYHIFSFVLAMLIFIIVFVVIV